MILARWALSGSAFLVIGTFGARALLGRVTNGQLTISRWAAPACALMLAASTALMLFVQLYAWFGASGFLDRENILTMLMATVWGYHWMDLATATAGVIVCTVAGVVWPRTAMTGSLVSAALVVWAVPLIGHGGTHSEFIAWCHRLHVTGAGLWIGTLAVLSASFARRPVALLLLRGFAPMALAGAALVAASGFLLALEHVRPMSSLWTTPYGRTLVLKIAAASGVGLLGFLNWRAPRTRVIAAELALALVLVLSLAAWLSELERPAGRVVASPEQSTSIPR